MTIIIGIDLGLSGAIAKVGSHGLMDMRDLPVMPRSASGSVKQQVNAAGLAELLKEWTNGHDKNEFHVLMERVQAMPAINPKTKKVQQGGASTFSLGHTAGIVEGVICAIGLAHDIIQPQVWKKHFKLTADKDSARALAQRYYPDASLARKKDHNRAEALLIARYGWELRG